MQLFTIGHSNRSFDEFLAMLQAFEIEFLVDVRTIPKSRYVPWSNQKSLNTQLQKFSITYFHAPNLGGRRHAKPDSMNMGWTNASLRGFADYMQTDEFFLGLKQLNELVKTKSNVVIMCAESLPWRCHRSLIADAEVARGIQVFHIMSQTLAKPHELTSFAVIDKKHKPIRVYYPDQKQLPLF